MSHFRVLLAGGWDDDDEEDDDDDDDGNDDDDAFLSHLLVYLKPSESQSPSIFLMPLGPFRFTISESPRGRQQADAV